MPKPVERDDRPVLLVENSQSVAQMVGAYLIERCGRQSQWARTLAQARTFLKGREGRDFLAAVVNLELPDASDEEIVSLLVAHGVPTVVLTGTFSEAKRQRILRHDIVDYCLKGKSGVEALVKVIERLHRNPSIKLLVVDDVAASRAQQLNLLGTQRFEVLQATDSEQALAMVREQHDYLVVLVSLSSDQKAVALISELREIAGPDDLAIIGLSTTQTSHTPAQYLKAGANDFIAKPFEKEEYFCRVYGCVDRASSMRRIQQLAFTDGLTGLANRLAFFQTVPESLKEALQERAKPGIALVSIDQLGAINELRGYQVGDLVLREVARSIAGNLGPGTFCARFTGQQFCVFVRDAAPTALGKLLERMRASVERLKIPYGDQELTVTISCGAIACEAEESIDNYVNRADTALDEAESTGGNRLILR